MAITLLWAIMTYAGFPIDQESAWQWKVIPFRAMSARIPWLQARGRWYTCVGISSVSFHLQFIEVQGTEAVLISVLLQVRSMGTQHEKTV